MKYHSVIAVFFLICIFSHPFQVLGHSRYAGGQPSATGQPTTVSDGPHTTSKAPSGSGWGSVFNIFKSKNADATESTTGSSASGNKTLDVKNVTSTVEIANFTETPQNVTPLQQKRVNLITETSKVTGHDNLITTDEPSLNDLNAKSKNTKKPHHRRTTEKPEDSETDEPLEIETTPEPMISPESVCELPELSGSAKNSQLANSQFDNYQRLGKSSNSCRGIRWQKATSETWSKFAHLVQSSNLNIDNEDNHRFICRVSCGNQTFPGELNPSTGNCTYTNHLSHEASTFQVLSNPCGLHLKFVRLSRPKLPNCPVLGGLEQHNPEDCDGRQLGERAAYTFIGRTVVKSDGQDRHVLGKVTPDRKLYYSVGNAEDVTADFEVLVLNKK